MTAEVITRRIRVYGIVQGVGFRPTVARHANVSGINGTVINKGSYVEIIAQGSEKACDLFLELLKKEPPIRAYIIKISVQELGKFKFEDNANEAAASEESNNLPLYNSFTIEESEHTDGDIYISPDIAICDDCKRELYDKNNRRYLHPFINCTNCGPRMTILDALPYDRERTSMKVFPMCPECSKEYHSRGNRRFDAQPVCCNNCGPEVYILNKESGKPDEALTGSAAITYSRRIISNGGIIAVKGIGGFHLCCDASNENAVKLLRERKHRPSKPFAVMMHDINTVKRECVVTDNEAKELEGHRKPIVLLEGRKDAHCRIASSVAPGNPKLGVMLPYAPVQLLLFDYNDGIAMPDCLVMTSANESGAPICRDDNDALNELSELADAILSNNRLIRVRADDTVTDFFEDKPYMIRRSRGFAPLPVMFTGTTDETLSESAKNDAENASCALPASQVSDICEIRKHSVLGIGGELKNSFCIGTGNLFYSSPYIGDLGDIRTITALRETISRFMTLLETSPEAIACDMHPLYQSRNLAYEICRELESAKVRDSKHSSIRLFELQHHYAHVLSCMAENNVDEAVIGVSFDGTGYGTDKTIWGGELLISDWNGFLRAGHISPFIQVGGDASSKEGWRIAAQMISDLYKESAASEKSAFFASSEYSDADKNISDISGNEVIKNLELCSEQEFKLIGTMAKRGINSVRSTSAGRLFDAVSAVLNIKRASSFEGEASTALMYAASAYHKKHEDYCNTDFPYSLIDVNDDGSIEMNTRALFRYITDGILNGKDIGKLAYDFHLILSDMTAAAVIKISELTGIRKAALSGGVFQNTLLLSLVKDALTKSGITVLTHSLIPPNDGGIGLGQAVYAMKQLNKDS
ncbi:MAG: carbamoyltransferase HypF [Lachnospiraceae bacterium]|nr:carbamoyltransferase HypF [Lachnospiraceae bacterium]